MDLGLRGKVALVAGGSSGLGLGAATELAREGADVVIGARDPDRLAAARKVLEAVAGGGRVGATSVDVTAPDAARRWVDEVAAEYGALHVAVISGPSPSNGTATGLDLPQVDAALDTVLRPAVGLALAALPHMRAAGWGRLLFVTSETVSVPIAHYALSGLTRAAIVRFAQSLAADVGRDGVTVNVLAPGAHRTPLIERAATRLAGSGERAAVEAQVEAIGGGNAVGRIGRPDEFGAVAAFLASERASYVTGTVHLVDGGGAGAVGPLPAYLTGAGQGTFT